MAKEKAIDWTVLGRVIGTATGWDQADTFVMQLYDFKPVVGCGLPAAECITFDFEHGTAETYTDAGGMTASIDLIAAIGSIPFEAEAA